jgi:protein arginine N-methyltransferase 5
MPRLNVAYALPHPLPPPPTTPHPSATPLYTTITQTIQSTDFDLVALPLTNDKWRERWDRLCTRAVEDGEPSEADIIARDEVDREADIWRRDGGLEFGEVNMTRLEEAHGNVGIAADWLEMDSPDEGIRFDSELVRSIMSGWFYDTNAQ